MLSLINFWTAGNVADVQQKNALQSDLTVFISSVNRILDDAGRDLNALAESDDLRRYLSENVEPSKSTLTSNAGSHELPSELEASLKTMMDQRRHFERVICFGPHRQPLFVTEISKSQPTTVRIYTNNFVIGLPRPDEKAWTAANTSILRAPLTAASFGASQVYTVPVFLDQARAALVGQVNVDAVLAEAARPIEARNGNNHLDSMVIVLDRSGTVLYHSNDALRHQPVASALPSFVDVANSMTANLSGTSSFSLSNDKEYMAAFRPVPAIEASAAVASNPALAVSAARRAGWLGILLSVLIAFGAAFVLSRYWQRQSRGIDRVSRGVTAIAKGELDHHIDVGSGDEVRVIADNINLMTERLREQLARDAEARQFESFVRLSAMLTHDLKNAIEALSLIVGNMETHFHNEQFRTDVMKSLTLATEKLKSLVSRITNPVNTLSGEHRRPVPVDLTIFLRRVVEMIGEPVGSKYQINLKLPEPVNALVDPDRIERVMENLMINAIEAMGDKGGTLTIEAGPSDSGKRVFFSVSDSGPGMTEQFIAEKLFHPFATTKNRGVGLGLYTCREVVRANAGSIEVQSIEGVGTTFRVVLPSATVARQT
ncbi:MAG TPA: ATP-binding protein [Pyrinomonadaceae bacterium]